MTPPVRIAFRIVCRCASRYASCYELRASLSMTPHGKALLVSGPAHTTCGSRQSGRGGRLGARFHLRPGRGGSGSGAQACHDAGENLRAARQSARHGGQPRSATRGAAAVESAPPRRRRRLLTLPRKPESEQQDAPDKRKSLSDRRNDGPAAKVGEESKSRHRMPDVSADLERAGTVPVASKAHSTASRSSERKTKKNAHSYGFAAGAAPGSAEKPGEGSAQNSGYGQHRSQDTLRQDAGKRSSGKRRTAIGNGGTQGDWPGERGRALNARGQNAMPQPAATPATCRYRHRRRATKGFGTSFHPSSPEVMRRDSALEQRHAVSNT